MSAIKSQGATIGIGDGGGPETFADIEGVISVTVNQDQAQDIDATNLASTSQEFLVGLPGSATVGIEMHYDSVATQQAALRALVASQALNNYKVTLSNGDTITFAAYAKNFDLSYGLDDTVKASATLRGTGDLTYA